MNQPCAIVLVVMLASMLAACGASTPPVATPMPLAKDVEDYSLVSSADLMASGKVVLAMGYARDVLEGRAKNSAITYVLPQEGALLWGDTFTIPTHSTNKTMAGALINFFLRPDINAQIANGNQFATPNEAAHPLVKSDILNDPVIFPPEEDVKNAEIVLPLSPEAQKMYDEIWERFMSAKP
jgi:spermidine/putrescine transport system substrate-binding protein